MPNKSAALEKEMKVRSAKPNKWLRFYRCIPLYLMFLPGALYLLMDKYIPMSGLIIAFKKVNWRKGILASDWVGFSNFTYLFKTKDAFNITRNTLLYNLCFIVHSTQCRTKGYTTEVTFKSITFFCIVLLFFMFLKF